MMSIGQSLYFGAMVRGIAYTERKDRRGEIEMRKTKNGVALDS